MIPGATWLKTWVAAASLALAACASVGSAPPSADTGRDWPGYGRLADQSHHSPLAAIDRSNVAQLGLVWSLDLPAANSATQPVAVDGVLYFAAGLSVVHAVDAATGRELWQYDPEVGMVGGLNMRVGWGVRGLAFDAGRVFVGTQDGRLIALNAASGKLLWSVKTFAADDPLYISGAPRVFGGKVLIGNAGTIGAARGFVTAYDAATGKQLWRFYTVPGDPAKGFESEAMAMAAKTWSGEWWKFGGGGMVWNSMAFDEAAGLVYIGTGSPYPWNHRIRSDGRGDNLFVGAIVALDLNTGEYRWHYQTVPGDTWDFDATMDIELADLTIEGRSRKVLMQAPKNGYFYVIDRLTGELISAQNYVKVTWAKGIDRKTGRPIEAAGARFAPGRPALAIAPTPLAAHNWMPMAFNPDTGLVYIPAVDWEVDFSDITRPWKPATDRNTDGAVDMKGGAIFGMSPPVGWLIAWDPVRQKEAWRVHYPTYYNGGVLSTSGGLVFQGSIDGKLRGYDAANGKVVWEYDTRAPLIAPPIAYQAGGRQMVTVLTGLGMGYVINSTILGGPEIENYGIDPRSQARRVLTFALGGTKVLPLRAAPPPPPDDPGFAADPALVGTGAVAYGAHCYVCHGALAIGIGNGPDLRRSGVTIDKNAFDAVVRGGAMQSSGMPPFGEFDDAKLESIRHYLRSRAADLRSNGMGKQGKPATGSLYVN